MSESFNTKINVGVEKYSYDLVFGYDDNSDETIYNKETDKYAPPTPPMNFFDAALGLKGERYYSKIVKTTDEEIKYSIYIQLGDNEKITISWNNDNLDKNLEYCKLQDAYGGKLDINCDMLKESKIDVKNGLINVLHLIFKKK